MDKTNPPLLAIGQQIETDLLLSLDDQASRIVLRLFERRAFPSKFDLAALGCRQPSRTRKTADGGRRQGRKLHSFASQRNLLPIYTEQRRQKQPFHRKPSVIALLFR